MVAASRPFPRARQPNQRSLDPRIVSVRSDPLELERRHALGGEPGSVKLLRYRNRVAAGRFDDAIAALRADPARNAAACTAFS